MINLYALWFSFAFEIKVNSGHNKYSDLIGLIIIKSSRDYSPLSVSLVDGHGPGVGFEAVVELPRARDLFVDEGGRARRSLS